MVFGIHYIITILNAIGAIFVFLTFDDQRCCDSRPVLAWMMGALRRVESDIAQPSIGASSLISGVIFDLLFRFVSVILGLLYAGPKALAYIRNRYH